MLSRVAAPSMYLRMASQRPFSTSIAMRAGPPKDAPPVRLNPLVGNVAASQVPTPKVAEPEAPKIETPKPSKTPIVSNIPPPPPPPAENASASAVETPAPQEQYAYSATVAPLDIASIISNKSEQFAASLVSIAPMSRPQTRAKAVTGRTVFIRDRPGPNTSTTPVSAINTLNRMIRNDHVRNKYHSQKFHERKGLKKKRLRSERWRSRFKDGFKATVSRVLELKRQGW